MVYNPLCVRCSHGKDAHRAIGAQQWCYGVAGTPCDCIGWLSPDPLTGAWTT